MPNEQNIHIYVGNSPDVIWLMLGIVLAIILMFILVSMNKNGVWFVIKKQTLIVEHRAKGIEPRNELRLSSTGKTKAKKKIAPAGRAKITAKGQRKITG